MYRPDYSINENAELVFELIRDFPLGLMISEKSGSIETNYLPFLIVKDEDGVYLLTHLTKSNPHWKNLSSEVVVSFLGPNNYISPKIYVEKNNVPTWSYAAVEVRGVCELITDGQGIKDILNKTVHFFETQNQTNWKYDLPAQMQKHLEAAIVGVKIKVTHIESKFKLGQNRSDEDYNAVLNHFKKSEDLQEKELYSWMLKAPK